MFGDRSLVRALVAGAVLAALPVRAEITFRFDEEDSTAWFGTGTLALHLDRQMRYEAFLCDPAGSLSVTVPLASLADSLAPQTITIGLTEIGDFRLPDLGPNPDLVAVSSPCWGPGMRLLLRGRSATRDLEKMLAVELYETHPDAAVFRTSYRNLESQELTVTCVRENRLLLDLGRASPGSLPYDFLTVQPTIDAWGQNWIGVPLSPGFSRSNRLMGGTVCGRGGMPFLDLWGPPMGLGLASLESVPTALYFPCLVRSDQRVEIGVEARPFLSFGQMPTVLAPGDTWRGPRAALIVHRGDFYDAAYRYGRLLECALAESGRETFGPYPESAFASYWKTWGFGLDFTLEDVYAQLNDLADLGFQRVSLDDGWFDIYGKWDPDPVKFPGGAPDLMALVEDLHTPQWGSAADSFEVMLWWNVTGWEAASGLGVDLLVRDAAGGYPVDSRGHRYLCPAYGPAVEAMVAMVDKMMGSWGVDGLYMDGDGLLNVPPCYNALHGHGVPAEAPEKLPELYRAIRDAARAHRPGGCLILCECSAPHDPYKMPYYHHEDASDPITDRMMRWKVKFVKGLRGPRAPVGDGYVDPMVYNEISGTFAYGLGVGSILTSMYTSLETLGAETWREWTDLHRTQRTSRAEVLNLYDVGFEFPEGHALRQDDGTLIYLFASELPWSGSVELRGLEPEREYVVADLYSGAPADTVSGPAAWVTVTMRQQAAGKPYWIVLKASPVGGGTGISGQGLPAEESRGRQGFQIDVRPMPSAGGVILSVRRVAGAVWPPGTPRLAVFDVRGRRVRGLEPAGLRVATAAGMRTFDIPWDGCDESGRAVPSGIYLVRMDWGREARTVRVVVAR